MNANEAVRSALAHHQAGQFQQAETIYREILAKHPEHPDALHFLGLLSYQTGHSQQALDLMRRAVSLKPSRAMYHSNLGEVWLAMGQTQEAITCHQKAISIQPGDAMAHYSLGKAFDAKGMLREAEHAYRRTIELNPNHTLAHNNLGTILARQGRMPDAIAAYHQAIAIDRRLVPAHYNLAAALQSCGQLEEAAAEYREAIALQPSHALAHNNLGNVLLSMGRPDEAIECYRRTIAIQPDLAIAHNNLASALQARGQLADAVESYRSAIALNPSDSTIHYNLGNALAEQGRTEDAIAAYRQALLLRPDDASAHHNLAGALASRGELDLAAAHYRRAIELRPEHINAMIGLGNVLQQQDRLDEALETYRKATTLCPAEADAQYNAANVLFDLGRVDDAIAAYRAAASIRADDADIQHNLGRALAAWGDVAQAIDCFERAVALRPEDAAMHSSLLLSLQYSDRHDARQRLDRHLEYARRHAEPLRASIAEHANDPDPARRLRIGYVSPDFREHPVAFFIESVLANHNREQFEVFCYSDTGKPDGTTSRVRNLADTWRGTASLSHAALSEQIRQDGIDILVDLAGHTAGNRLPVFARKPTPVQVTYLGYPDTTGLQTIDYRLTDAWADPEDVDPACVERLWRLPAGFLCYRPPEQAPAPALPDGPITFACFSNLAKVGPSTTAAWAAVLKSVPGSRLLIKSPHVREQSTTATLAEQLVSRGLPSGRVEVICARPSLSEHLDLYRQVHIVLDTFPYNGTTSTCEALWMGVPIVTLAGSAHAGRVGASILSRLGLGELVAQTPQEYVQIAASLAADIERLAAMRSGLRRTMAESSLTDGHLMAANLESAYRQMWAAWCSTEA